MCRGYLSSGLFTMVYTVYNPLYIYIDMFYTPCCDVTVQEHTASQGDTSAPRHGRPHANAGCRRSSTFLAPTAFNLSIYIYYIYLLIIYISYI